MQTQGRNFFSVLAYGYYADDRISYQKNLLFSENLEVNQHKVANLKSIVPVYPVCNYLENVCHLSS